jgi:hypothetical protein
MAYTPPSGNVTSLNQVLVWVNQIVDGLLIPGTLGVIWFIIFIRLLFTTNETGKAWTAASFICMIASVLLRLTDLINTAFMVIFIIFTGIGVVWMHTENAKYG